MDQIIKNQLIAECNELHNHLLHQAGRGIDGVPFHPLGTLLEIIQTEFKKFENSFISKSKLDRDLIFKKEVHAYTIKCAKKCLSALSSYG